MSQKKITCEILVEKKLISVRTERFSYQDSEINLMINILLKMFHSECDFIAD